MKAAPDLYEAMCTGLNHPDCTAEQAKQARAQFRAMEAVAMAAEQAIPKHDERNPSGCPGCRLLRALSRLSRSTRATGTSRRPASDGRRGR